MTDEEFAVLREEAHNIRLQYKSGSITVGEAKKLLKPFEKEFNRRSKEKAAKYGVKAQKLSVLMWINLDV